MTLFYPDIASYQAGINLNGTVAVCGKSTEGTTYFNPYYNAFKSEAASHGAYFFSYHFLRQGNASAQADYCFSKIGATPLMLDVESTGSSTPGINDVTAFVDRFRNIGGKVWLVYLPKWYWQSIGSPSLNPLISRGLLLVSSNYPSGGYSENGPGWASYGGMTPLVWQYTASQNLNGYAVDYNAFKGDLDDFKSYVETGAPVPPVPPDNDEDDMNGQLSSSNFVTFPAGRYGRIMLYRDWVSAENPAIVRVALHSKAHGYQVISFTLNTASPGIILFSQPDVDAISLVLTSGPAPVGYSIW